MSFARPPRNAIATCDAGDWDGTGIISSVAGDPDTNAAYTLGINDNALRSTAFTTFDGETVDSTTVIVKFTYHCDLNLDGIVDVNDSFKFSGSYVNNAASTWAKGDLNFDGFSTLNDVFMFNGKYNESLPQV